MRRTLIFLVVVLSPLVLIRSDVRLRAQAPASEQALRTAGDRPIDIQHLRLDMNVDLPKKTVDAKATLKIKSLRAIRSISLDAVEFEVTRVALGDDKHGVAVNFSQEEGKLVIDLGSTWPANQAGTLHIDYRIRDPRAGLHFFGPTKVEPDVPLTVWSQGEPVTNRYWIPCLDQPNQRQTTELIVTVAEGFEVLSNGRLVKRQSNPEQKTVTFHWLQDKPHVAYLVTLVVGQFDIVREEWNDRPVLYYVPKGRKEEVGRSFGRTREMLTFFSKRFGIDYPWDKYAQVVVEQFTAGGMENTSATTLTDRALHDERSSLDGSSDGLIAHELAHQWWGDLVTCRDWSHIWLNEGFASFCEVVWSEHHEGADEGAYNLMQKGRAAILGGKERPVVDRRYSFPGAMFDARAYPKGAWVLHMLRRRLGDDVFWKCVQRYGTEHRLQSADTGDFRKTFEKETGRNLERFFYDWTERPGCPVLEIGTQFLPESKQARFAVKQTQPGEAFHFPLKIACRCQGQVEPVVITQEITEKEQTIYAPLPGRPTLVVIDPDQAVLAEFKETKGRDLWVAQLREAPEAVSRIRAARHFGQSKTAPDRELLAQALVREKFWGVQAEIATALGESGGDACRDGLIQGLKLSNPKARRACAEHLGQFRHDQAAADALKELLKKGDPSYNVEGTALSTYGRLHQADAVTVLLPWLAKASHNEILRTAALTGLGASQDLSCLDSLMAWTKRGKPRQCRMAALLALAQLAQKGNPNEEQQRQIVRAAAACLEGETPFVRRAAVMALRDLGRTAAPALSALETLARHDPDERIRDLAKTTGDKIRSNSPVPVELSRLREELDRLRKANQDLQDRLNKFERLERKGG